MLAEAAQISVLQVHLSGSETLLPPDLLWMVARACDLELSTHLISSGIGLTQRMLDGIVAADLDHNRESHSRS